MADKLTYKGGARVVANSGTAKLVLPAGGGDFHRVPKWWGKKGTVSYVEAAIFKVPLDNGSTVRLVLPDVKSHMTVEIRHDGAGNFTFPNDGNLERAAVTAVDSLAVLVEYQFSKISGGAVLKRSIGALPDPPAGDTFETRLANAEYVYNVTVVNPGSGNVYALNGTNQLPVTMSVNETFAFDFSGVAGAHPLAIFTDATKSTPVTAGVETGGAGNATLLFKPTSPGTFSYQCINHANMGGDITVN